MQIYTTTKFVSFIYYLQNVVNLSEDAKEFIAKNVTLRRYKRGDIIFESGKVCDNFYFVKKGLVRGYITEEKKEITLWAVDEDNMITSVSGYFSKSISKETAECLEETIVECFSYQAMTIANKRFPEVYDAYVKLIETYYASSEFRCFIARIPNAKRRFEIYAKNTSPSLLRRIPNKYLASMLSMRPETLSRIFNH